MTLKLVFIDYSFIIENVNKRKSVKTSRISIICGQKNKIKKMKKIEAIVKPSKLKAIQAGLIAANIPCMTVIPVKGAGMQKGYAEVYRGTERPLILLSKVMIICVVSEENVEKCVDVILDNASEENVGDGKIFIYDVVDAIRIRNRQRGVDAIR